MTRLLIFGGAGFLGNALTRRLLQEGHRIDRLVRRPVQPLGVHDRLHPGDLGDRALLSRLLDACDVVVHLASDTTPGSSTGQPVMESQANLMPSLGLLEALQSHPGLPLLFVSSGGTLYGNPAASPVSENAPLQPLSYHGAGKLAMEAFLHALHQQYGNPVCILRPSNLYGPGQSLRDGFGLIRTMLEHARAGTPMTLWGDGGNVRDYLYIDDMVEALVQGIDQILAGPAQPPRGWRIYNVGAGVGLSILEVHRLVESITGRELHFDPRPARSGDVRSVVLDCARITGELGWRAQTPLSQGIARTWAWLESQP